MHSPAEHSVSTWHEVTFVLRPEDGQPAAAKASNAIGRSIEEGSAVIREAIVSAFFMAGSMPSERVGE